MKTAYSLEINSRGEIEIVTPAKRTVIGLPHNIGMPQPIPEYAEEMIRRAGANPEDYFWCGGRAIRNTHREQMESMISSGKAAYRLTPAGLREYRSFLTERIRCASAAAADERTANFHRFDTGEGMGRNAYDEKAETARAELASFDAEHPEILAAIDAEKAEAIERNFWM